MKVKTDTKEKFHVVGIAEPHLSANMTEDLCSQLQSHLQSNIRNIVLNLKGVQTIDEDAAEILVKTQQKFYEENSSFVCCEMNAAVEKLLDESNLLEVMNVTPTESEAADIVQMEEIERELMDEEEENPQAKNG